MNSDSKKVSGPKILITGGCGFLGKRIVEEFGLNKSVIDPGHLRVLDQKMPEEEQASVEYIQGDIRDYDTVLKACRDMDIVVHSAAIIDWGTNPESIVLDINVGGTENVIKACREAGVKHLVYTSSLDAIYTGKPLVDIDESQPYPEQFKTVYCESKMLSEVAVNKAHSGGLSTCILRPSDIYGEGDPYHIDSLVDMAKSGFYVRLGNGKSKCQHVYVGNMAYSHVLAAAALWKGNQKVNGSIYLITDGPGYNFFKFFDQVVIKAGYKIFPNKLWLPRGLAYSIGSISEGIAIMARPIKRYNPKFSRFAVVYTCTDFTFSSKKAEEELGFHPKYKTEEAVERTAEYYRK